MANNHGGTRPGAGRPKTNAPKFGQWISVEDRLPEEDCACLTWDEKYPGSGVCIGWFCSDRKQWTDGDSNIEYPTFWLPLPPPPDA